LYSEIGGEPEDGENADMDVEMVQWMYRPLAINYGVTLRDKKSTEELKKISDSLLEVSNIVSS